MDEDTVELISDEPLTPEEAKAIEEANDQLLADLGESNRHLLAENTQMKALLVGWYSVIATRFDWPREVFVLADATREFVNKAE